MWYYLNNYLNSENEVVKQMFMHLAEGNNEPELYVLMYIVRKKFLPTKTFYEIKKVNNKIHRNF